jgi:hypothetical protein
VQHRLAYGLDFRFFPHPLCHDVRVKPGQVWIAMSDQPEDAAPKSVHDLLKVWTERDPRFQSMVVSYFTIDERWVTAIDSHLPN